MPVIESTTRRLGIILASIAVVALMAAIFIHISKELRAYDEREAKRLVANVMEEGGQNGIFLKVKSYNDTLKMAIPRLRNMGYLEVANMVSGKVAEVDPLLKSSSDILGKIKSDHSLNSNETKSEISKLNENLNKIADLESEACDEIMEKVIRKQ